MTASPTVARQGGKGGTTTNTVTTKDGTGIYYKDLGKGQPVIFSHDWPLSADACEPQMGFPACHGHRAGAYDRRDRSEKLPEGNEMDTHADLLDSIGG